MVQGLYWRFECGGLWRGVIGDMAAAICGVTVPGST
jgi:hypothetical protein